MGKSWQIILSNSKDLWHAHLLGIHLSWLMLSGPLEWQWPNQFSRHPAGHQIKAL